MTWRRSAGDGSDEARGRASDWSRIGQDAWRGVQPVTGQTRQRIAWRLHLASDRADETISLLFHCEGHYFHKKTKQRSYLHGKFERIPMVCLSPLILLGIYKWLAAILYCILISTQCNFLFLYCATRSDAQLFYFCTVLLPVMYQSDTVHTTCKSLTSSADDPNLCMDCRGCKISLLFSIRKCCFTGWRGPSDATWAASSDQCHGLINRENCITMYRCVNHASCRLLFSCVPWRRGWLVL